MDKFIDKLIDTSWFMKGIALVLAFLLFQSVYDPNQEVSDVNVPGGADSAVLTDIPVKTYYDTENLVVSGVPSTVTVALKGPISHLQPAKTQRNFEVYVDLADAKIGSVRVPIEIRNISENLEATIEPAYADVTIQEKVTKEFNVEAEFDASLLEEGYIAESPVVNPGKVKITGAKDQIDKISYVRATVAIDGPISETVTKKAAIRVLDQDMNKLDVIVEPDSTMVKIPVRQLSKTVPIRIVENGEAQSGVTINSISINQSEANISGSEATLAKAESVRVEVDISQITEDSEITLPVIISEGITAVDPDIVTAKIDVTINETDTEEEQVQAEEQSQIGNQTYSNLPIRLNGLSEQYNAVFNGPSNGQTNLIVTGTGEQLEQLDAGDFQLFLDLANLGVGSHEVKINVNAPTNIKWSLARESANITISEKDI